MLGREGVSIDFREIQVGSLRMTIIMLGREGPGMHSMHCKCGSAFVFREWGVVHHAGLLGRKSEW